MRSTQRSSSNSRGSRRSTLAIGAGGVLPGLHSGSLSPERALRTRVLREKNDVDGIQPANNDTNGKPKVGTKAASKGVTRPQQQVYFAFGSKVSKPAFRKGGAVVYAGESRGRSAIVDTGIVVPRQRREKPTKLSTLEEPQDSTRGATATIARQQSSTYAKEVADDNHLKDKEDAIAELRRQLGSQTASDGREVSGKANGLLARSAAESSESGGGGGAIGAELKTLEDDLPVDLEGLITRMEGLASTGLSRVEKMQANVDDMMRMLKAQNK